MNPIMENLTGMNVLSDQVIATDFLIAAKSGVRNYALALTETASPQVREALKNQLNQAIATHEKITNLMISRGWYNAYDMNQQLQMDIQNTDTALNMVNQASRY
ncbi:spore coat protein [Paenibacillus montaniterrae]|uniref:Spore coat protein n=1 Tax=Paenibacillus montaniterrae TaxID=429341 RepID=A0A920D1C4_9BACL|nr:spore coat protein [Paenibacillus montaniterrae]GIP19448.1 spore coat protein [Paenibacillus montaniterrae]